MVEPVDVILAFHNTFRNDMERIDSAALDSARGRKGSLLPSSDSGSSMKCWYDMPQEKS